MSAVYILVGLIAYLIGSVNFAIIFSKKIAGFDVREKGSKNAGTTNVLRTVGTKVALLTLLCDILKGVIAIVVAIIAGKIWTNMNVEILKYLAGFFAILGHTFPIFFEFRGGKGVATALGVLITLNWKIGLICLIFALIIIVLLQSGKANDAGQIISGGNTVLLGKTKERGAEKFITRLTYVLGFAFIIISLILSIYQSNLIFNEP